MKVTDVRCFMHYSVWRNIIFVRVDTDEGISGIGEATIRNKEMAVKSAILEHIKPIIVGKSPFEVEKFVRTTFIQDAWRNGAVFNSAISGVEMALWDIIGKKVNQPVYNLIGGKLFDEVPLYANTWFMDAVSIDDYALAAKKTVDMGFKAIKWDPLKVVSPDTIEWKRVNSGIECLRAVREAVGDDIELFIELHGSLSYDGALQFALKSEKYRPGFLEEPMHPDDFTGYRKLKLTSHVPLAAGERYFTRFQHRELYEEGLYSIVQPDLMHSLGILEGKKMAAMAEVFGIKFAPHNSGGPVGTMASVTVDATCNNFYWQEFSIENFELSPRFFKEGLNIQNGSIILDDRPGLSLEPNWDEIERETYQYKQTY